MKFIHIADMHFDVPFTVLNNRNKLGEKRRLEQREALRKVINYIKENNIEYLFIAGDLYENEYIRQRTIEYINNLFKEIPNTKIYIAPGNHDPYIKSSMYNTFKWNDNVHIFNDKIELLMYSIVVCLIYSFSYKSPAIKKYSTLLVFIKSIIFLNASLCSSLRFSPNLFLLFNTVNGMSKCISAICTNFKFIHPFS